MRLSHAVLVGSVPEGQIRVPRMRFPRKPSLSYLVSRHDLRLDSVVYRAQ